MRRRTQARELALKALYQYDLRGELRPDSLEALCESEGGDNNLPFGRELVKGCLANLKSLDEIIEQTSENWRLDRMPIIDRNILRLATYEMLFRYDTPPKVVMNEAIELAKKYSTENSPTFVNGVLDKIFSLHAKDRKEGQEGWQSGKEDGQSAEGLLQRLSPDPMARADLHVHSAASDGSLSPGEVVRLAAQAGLAAVALTDHDCLDGIGEAAPVAEQLGIVLIPGVEMTAYAPAPGASSHLEMHLVGLFVDVRSKEFIEELARLRRVRVERIEKISELLRGLGFQFNGEEVLRRALGGSVGRVHVAQEMVRQGICKDIGEAFDRYIGAGRPAYVPKERLTPQEAIDLVHRAGGCAVLAHPGLTDGIGDILNELVKAGLDGIEVHYPGHSDEDAKACLDAAHRFGLAVSGGSDFHGAPKPEIKIGSEFVSMVEVCELAERAKKARSQNRLGCQA